MDRNIALTNGSTKPKAATGAASSPSRTTAPAASTAMSPVFPPIKKTKKTLSPKRLVRTGQLGKVSLPKVSSITFSAGYGSQPVDSGEELEVLKCILVREGYLQRLGRASAAGHVSGAHLGETVDLLDLIRLATLETVEAIVVWRKQKQKATTEMPDKSSEPFRWNGINYLLKLPSDLEFLGKHAGLTEWLGFTLERNPFVLPLNLDCRAKFLTEPKQALQSDAWRNTDDSIRFVQVGGKRSQVSGRESLGDTNVNAGAAEALSLALAERRRAKTPYETRVVNDEELVPTTPSKINALRSKARVPARVGRTSYSSILPSQIGDVDLARIHEAEAVVLHEESMFGRYARDYQGRVVPEDEAQRRIGMVELSGNAYNTPTSLSSSYTAENLENDAVRLADPVHSDVPGKLHAKKRSGMLGPISKPEWRSFERPPPPRRRARGAQLEETLVAERKANSQLGVLVDRLREETERKAMDIAYFESCSELQVFNEELQTFTSQALRELALLRRDLQEKQYVYESKIVNIQKKEEIFNTFKLQHKAIKDANHVKRIEISKRQATNVSSLHQEQQRREDQDQAEIRAHAEAEHREHEQAAPLVQHFCATQIQKIARGMLARELYAQLKIEYVVASTFIQAAIRGFLVRHRVAKLYSRNAASIQLQRIARGWLARQSVNAKRRLRTQIRSAERIQKVVRGRFGRVRMAKIRTLVYWRLEIALSADSVSAVALQELAKECQTMVALPKLLRATTKKTENEKPLPSLVLGLVRLLMIFTSDADDEWNIPNTRWQEAACFLSCCVSLARRMEKIAHAASGAARALTTKTGGFAAAGVAVSTPYLRESVLGAALIDAYRGDPEFRANTFERLPRGWKAAVDIFRWVTAFAEIMRLQHLIDPSYSHHGPFLVVQQTLSKREAQHESTEQRETSHKEEALARRFVPGEFVQARNYPHHRPRPLVLVVANDVPRKARSAILEKLQAALPGLFLVITRPPSPTPKSLRGDDPMQAFDFKRIRDSLALGHGVILEGDVGLRDVTQRAFLSCFATIKNGLHPSPMCVLLRGTVSNRSDLFEPKEGTEKVEEEYRAEIRRRMVDADVKLILDRTARLRLDLAEESVAREMVEMAKCGVGSSAPPPSLVVVMEAVIVLLTPDKIYEGPSHLENASAAMTGVSWQLSRQLLAQPGHLRAKLQRVDVTAVPMGNRFALERYMKHSLWPSAAVARSQLISSRLLVALAAWVESATQAASLIAADGLGCLAPEISRGGSVSGLFERVVVFSNCPTDFLQEGAGEDTAVMKLLNAVLADVRVYRTAHLLGNSCMKALDKHSTRKPNGEKERCVVSLFHECRRIFVSAYSPSSGCQWMTIISEDEVDSLLAPTAMPLGGEVRANKLTPQSHAEVYARLAHLCLLQRRRLDDLTDITNPLTQEEFVVRPKAIQLYRHVIRIGGFRATVTMSELARGQIQIDAYVHGSSVHKTNTEAAALTIAVRMEDVLGRMSSAQARRVFVPAPRIPSLMLDRLHLFRTTQTNTLAPDSQERLVTTFKLDIKTAEHAPGRMRLRRAIRVPESHSLGTPGERCVFTLIERHYSADFLAAFYIPRTSSYQSIRLSRNAAHELLHISRHTTPSRLQNVLLRKFCLTKAAAQPIANENADVDQDDQPEDDMVSHYRQRRRIISRFPCALRVVEDPHQHVTKQQVVRAYVQAELCDQDPCTEQNRAEQSTASRNDIDALRYRLWLPDCSVEQTLVLQESEIEASLPVELSWRNAFPDGKRIMSREIVRCYFKWKPDGAGDPRVHGIVVADLPCGSFTAAVATAPLVLTRNNSHWRESDEESDEPEQKPTKISTQKDQDVLPATAASCVYLLDERGSESDDEGEEDTENKRRRAQNIYSYDTEEMVHHGSYRANGLLVVVNVVMRAELRTDLRPRLSSPVDRVRESDTFLLKFKVYHPATSGSAIAEIRGEHELREVVGPDKAGLIASTYVEDLMRHIIRTRLDVQVDNDTTARLRVTFLRDRLYAKQKATPVTKTFARDSAINAAKLIDESRRQGAAGERGVKILTTTKVLVGCGRTLLTVFNIAADHKHNVSGTSSLILRVDAYVCASSMKLSLLLETNDLVHVVGEDNKELLMPIADIGASLRENTEKEESRNRKLALLVLDYLRIEQRKDGRGDRLVLADSCCAEIVEVNHKSKKSKRLFKTVRAVEHSQVLLSAYLNNDQGSQKNLSCLRLDLYDPANSSRCSLTLSQETLSALFGLPGLLLNDQLMSIGSGTALSMDPAIVMAHICSLLHIEKVASSSSEAFGKRESYSMVLLFDEQQAMLRLKQHFSRVVEDNAVDSNEGVIEASWTGMKPGVCGNYFSIHLQLLHTNSASLCRHATQPVDVDRWVVCSVFSPAELLVTCKRFKFIDIPPSIRSLLSETTTIKSSPELEVAGVVFLSKFCECLRVKIRCNDDQANVTDSSKSDRSDQVVQPSVIELSLQ